MKKILILLTIVFATHLLNAQSNPSIDKRAAYLTDWLSDILDLESQQKNKIFTIYKSYMNTMVTVLETYRDNVAELRNQKDVLEVSQQQSISAVLNEKQLEKYNSIISK